MHIFQTLHLYLLIQALGSSSFWGVFGGPSQLYWVQVCSCSSVPLPWGLTPASFPLLSSLLVILLQTPPSCFIQAKQNRKSCLSINKYQAQVSSPLVLQSVKLQMPIWANYTLICYYDIEKWNISFIPSFKLE